LRQKRKMMVSGREIPDWIELRSWPGGEIPVLKHPGGFDEVGKPCVVVGFAENVKLVTKEMNWCLD
jgi:hypothetical protein